MQQVDLFQIASSGATVWIINFLKGPSGPAWIRADTTHLNAWLSTAMALVFGLGITATGSMDVGWQIGIPPMHSIWDSLARIVVSRMQQEAFYKITQQVRPEPHQITQPCNRPERGQGDAGSNAQ